MRAHPKGAWPSGPTPHSVPGERGARSEDPTPGRGHASARGRLHRAGRWAAIALGAVVLALAFASYLSPDMAVTLMTQAWSCL
jgi:hypothetical protein